MGSSLSVAGCICAANIRRLFLSRPFFFFLLKLSHLLPAVGNVDRRGSVILAPLLCVRCWIELSSSCVSRKQGFSESGATTVHGQRLPEPSNSCEPRTETLGDRCVVLRPLSIEHLLQVATECPVLELVRGS